MSGGDGRDMVDDPALSDGPGVHDPEPRPINLPDPSLPAPPSTLGGCQACGFLGGECFTQDPTTCPSAKALARDRQALERPAVSPIEAFPTTRNAPVRETPDEGGVWVTYIVGQDHAHGFTVHASEVEALRHAVKTTRGAMLLKWGEEL